MKRLTGSFVITCKSCGTLPMKLYQNNGTLIISKEGEILIHCTACGKTELIN